MILLPVVAAWVLVLSLVAGLCVAARAGDLAQLAYTPAPAVRGRLDSPVWEPAEQAEVAVHANHFSVRREPVASLRSGDGVAA